VLEKATHPDITMQMVEDWCAGTVSDFTKDRLLAILRGEYPLNEAREDVVSLADCIDKRIDELHK
jgi:hypothetical protein